MPTAVASLFACEDSGGVTVVRILAPDLRGSDEAIALGEGLSALVDAAPGRRLLIDFGAVRRMGSTAFATLFILVRKLARSGGQLRLCGLHPEVRFGVEILGLGSVMEIHDDERAARAAFG